ncbi:DUF6383 domain-containing protein [Parabacteroides gordonii]|uniref:DUF6383 domain-containing protein n=1 Tax=Parabacteroides gordonii TaxID=574930 RepID=UPI0026ED034B|nr:DUF6383 domain-containing protein [Parabacteroides gordonii]
MNKKFSTLVASVLLAGAMGTVDAANYAKFTKVPTAAEKVTGKNYYQLTDNSNKVLAMLPVSNGQYELKMVATDDADATDLRYTLWQIVTSGNAEAGYSYSFVNYATNMYLAVSPNDAALLAKGGTIAAPTANVKVGGNVNVWKWVSAPDLNGGFANEHTALTSSFGTARDSVVILSAGTNAVGAVKYAAKDFNTTPTTGALSVIPADPAAIVLGADDLNSMLWKGDATGKMKLTFTDDVKGGNPAAVNLFTKQAYKAVPAVGFPANYTSVAEDVTASAKWTLGYTMDQNNAGELDNEYKDMFEKEAAYYNANAKAVFANAIKALLDKDEDGSTDYHTAVWGAYQGVGENVQGAAQGAEPLTLKDITDQIDKVDLAKVKAIQNITGLDKVSDEVLSSTLAAFKSALVSSLSAHAFNKGFNGVPQTVYTELLGTDQEMDQIIKAQDYAAKVKEYVTAEESAEEAYEKAVATAHTAFDKGAAKHGWISLQANDLKGDDATYLAVDTSFLTKDAGAKHLAFAVKNFKDKNVRPNNEDRTRMDLNGRFNFQFVWHPASDSIVIRTAGFAKKADATPYWSMMNAKENPNDLGMWRANIAAKGNKYERTAISAKNEGYELNLVKIAVLADNHREVTVGSSEFTSEKDVPVSTINTRISLNAGSQYELATLPSGVYFFNLSTGVAAKKYDNGKYYVAKFCGNNTDYEAEETTQLYGVAQDFGHMPRTQWVVVQNPGVAGQQTVNIYNREFPTMKYENIQLYKGGDKKVFTMFGFPTISVGDTLSYALAADVKPLAGVLTDAYLGYYKPNKENEFKLNRMTMDYFSGIQLGNFVDVAPTANDTTVRVDVKGNKATFQLVPSADAKYGYEGSVAPQLYRRYYTIKVYDGNKLVNDAKWIARDVANENTYKVTANAAEAVKFYLKENNQIVTEEGDTLCYHALVDFDNAARVGVRDGSLKFSIEGVCSEERVATFHVDYDQSIIYRELKGNETTAVAEGVEPFSAPCVANFFRARIADKQYLFESANQAQFNETGKGINFLGVRYEGGQFNDSTAMYVDTADVRNPYRPQYMLAVGTEIVAEGKYCPIHGFNAGCKEEHLLDVPAQVWGRYLINAQDSLNNAANGADYQWEKQYTRLSFVHAMHTGDTLIVFKNGEYPLTNEGHKDYLKAMEWARAAAANTVTPNENDYVYVMNVKDRNGNNATKAFAQDYANYKFMFRLVDDKDTRDFIIENHDNAWGLHNDTYTAAENTGEYRAIKVQNGVPVIARFTSASEGMLNAEWWNIDERCTIPTANEGIEASEVSVVAANGAVIIKGAVGKNVVITNVLGQTIANTVLSSDNATIAAPAGVVVVAVEGEAAVKAIVK